MKDPVVMLTALNLEYDAVRRRLVDPRVCLHERGTRFEVGTLGTTTCRVVIGLTGKGNHSAAVLAERAIQQFSPTAVMFVGVAGALWGTPLGDVVVATHVYAYHGGTSEDDGLKARPRTWEMAHEMAQLAAHVGRSRDWADTEPARASPPGVHFGAIAAGEIVQNSRISREAGWIREHYNDALAIEMEAAGVAQAGHLSGAPVAIIRGISDQADGSKATDGDITRQPAAAANAAAFAARLAVELVGQQEERTSMHEAEQARHRGGNVNFAWGNVGIQAADVSGSSVVMNAVPPTTGPSSIGEQISAFRELLALSRSAGRLDSATYDAAATELDVASKALRDNTAAGRSKVVLALKRLRDLVVEVADLSAKVVAVIAAVQGLS
ncbi:5'-methylthioadenosine/S-adenosylhomocysteine nucleosidase [Kibdelosporangium phytohabitans]|uniref:Purine phosphorylase n=1 Tax=Kibdelosporangium phytohabitans TaxID=860235 RepID=A0A0N9HVZ1_9PSEU|nr:5'-methylthioadenosine/S-adenosylhomocysteine nucleosidase [Kibdelosporangium phytohabitans]ALG09395.1 purine phosphorylase [Kibdelosporangium phytohabitans]MBE1469333.1 nucleoside phosphorylase [Kibdelosporangium phytohabitans]